MERIEELVGAIRDAATGLLDASWRLSGDAGALGRIAALKQAAAVLDAAMLRAVRDADTRPGVSVVGFYADHLGHAVSSAKRDLAAAHALDPVDGELRALGAAYAAGEIFRPHVDVAVRVPNRIPGAVRERQQEVDGFLTTQARELPPRALARVAGVLDPKAVTLRDEEVLDQRGVWIGATFDGLSELTYRGTGLALAKVMAVSRAAATPEPARDDGQGVLIVDRRSKAQRYADAFELVFASYDGPRAATAEVLIVATPEQAFGMQGAGMATDLGDGSPVSPGTLREVPCDAIVRVGVHREGERLDLGMTHRLATHQQRRALAVRDGGCVIPGCPMPPSACRAHTCSSGHAAVRGCRESGAGLPATSQRHPYRAVVGTGDADGDPVGDPTAHP